MKKSLLILGTALAINANAQITLLFDFDNNPNGSLPQGNVMQASDGMLYGMTPIGGAGSEGVLFQYNSSTNTYAEKLAFAGTGQPIDGQSPYGSLIQASNGMLYGMTSQGGANGGGIIFQYNPTTSTYTKKFDFDNAAHGADPLGSLMQASDGMLYGMTSGGGANNLGVLFQYNPTTNVCTNKVDFAGATNGSTPKGSLMQASDGMLYGMTSLGGANADGVLFQYNPTTSVYTKKLDFTGFGGSIYGQNPAGSLMQASNGMLYGMTEQGGSSNSGVLFQYNPTTSAYTKEFDFAGTGATIDGMYPQGALIQASNGMLYAMTYHGGANNVGVIFQYNTTTSVYTKKYDFGGSSTNGNSAYGDLLQASDGNLYGMTYHGGGNANCASGCGVLFKYGIGATGIEQFASNNIEVNIYPNPSNGSFVIEPNSAIKQTMQVYDVNGKLVLTQTINGKTSIDASSLNEGVYNVSLQSNEGVVNKRVVIVR